VTRANLISYKIPRTKSLVSSFSLLRFSLLLNFKKLSCNFVISFSFLFLFFFLPSREFLPRERILAKSAMPRTRVSKKIAITTRTVSSFRDHVLKSLASRCCNLSRYREAIQISGAHCASSRDYRDIHRYDIHALNKRVAQRNESRKANTTNGFDIRFTRITIPDIRFPRFPKSRRKYRERSGIYRYPYVGSGHAFLPARDIDLRLTSGDSGIPALPRLR